MYKRIVFIISVALFAFLAFVAVIVTELHDREFPVARGTKAAADLDFRWTRMSNEEAFRQLGMLSARLGLGLIRVAPDLEGDPSGQVFVVLGQEPAWTGPVPRFGNQPDGRILGKDALAPSYATGTYLVTGETAHLAEFRAWLAEHRVEQRWGEDTLGTVLEWLVRQSEFGTALLACAAMMVSLALYWLTVKARGRAIRVLAGVSTWRIQYEGLGGFLMVLVAAAVLSNACAVPYVGFVHGWIFVPYYAKVLAIFEIAVIAVTMALALVLAAVSWPSPAMLAAREPAVKTLRNGTAVLRLVTYTLILATIGPAITAFAHAKDAAAEQAMWKALADQVVLSFPLGTTESDFQRLMPHVGQVVQAAESRNAVAFSYAIPGEHLRINRHDIAPYRYLVLVNQRWLDLMLSQGQPRENPGREPAAGFVPLSLEEVPEGARSYLDVHAPLWVRKPSGQEFPWNQVAIYRYEGRSKLPFAYFGGDLVFPKANEALIVLVPRVHELFNDDFLISVASSSNLVFTGLEETQRLIAQHGLQESIRVNYSAEEGILRAQLMAYFAWLRGASLAALVVAFGVATGIGAFITAVLTGRRDFVLRLAGKSWWTILRHRVLREWGAGAAVAALVVMVQRARSSALILSDPSATGLVAVALAFTILLLLPLVHYFAAQWVFTKVSLRRL